MELKDNISMDFSDLKQHGIECDAFMIYGVPSVFELNGRLVAYDQNDDCFVIAANEGLLRLGLLDKLNIDNGIISVSKG